jgi:hypothetical protein
MNEDIQKLIQVFKETPKQPLRENLLVSIEMLASSFILLIVGLVIFTYSLAYSLYKTTKTLITAVVVFIRAMIIKIKE